MYRIKFYKQVLAGIAVLFAVSLVVLLIGNYLAHRTLQITPKAHSDVPWIASVSATPDIPTNAVKVYSEDGILDFSFLLSSQHKYPYNGYHIQFNDSNAQTVDLSAYSQITFKVRCETRTQLAVVFITKDEFLEALKDGPEYRYSDYFFRCEPYFRNVAISFDRFASPEWWLLKHSVALSDRGEFMDVRRVHEITFASSLQNPNEKEFRIQVDELKLEGFDAMPEYVSYAFLACTWIVFFVWFFRAQSVALVKDIKVQVNQSKQIVAYQKLSIAPLKDRQKSAILSYMATEYSNSELNLDSACATLGVNRAKISEALKDELGLTFSAYLNKLRLTEAARLLSESPNANISEVSRAVGYNNVSYFGQLFRAEYGCTPKSFSGFCDKGCNADSEIT